jgi:starch phosphorylase
MLREYVDRLYLKAAQNYHKRSADGANESVRLCHWRELLETYWQKLHFGRLDVQREADKYIMTVKVYLDKLDPKAVQVQLFAEPQGNGESEIHVMEVAEADGTANSYLYRARIPARRPAEHYTPRIIPYFDGAAVPLEARQILWYES